jgi:hypothetical protein
MQTLAPKYDINVRVSRRTGVARVTFLKNNCRRTRNPYHFCTEEALQRGDVTAINNWLGKNNFRQQPHLQKLTPKQIIKRFGVNRIRKMTTAERSQRFGNVAALLGK